MGAGNHFNINRRNTEIEVILDFNFDYTAEILILSKISRNICVHLCLSAV